MTIFRSTPARSYVWIILIGVSSFIALFYTGFRVTSTREAELLDLSSRQDSLLSFANEIIAGVEDRLLDTQEAAPSLNATWSAFDSLLTVSEVVLPEQAGAALAEFQTYGSNVLRDVGSTDHHRRERALSAARRGIRSAMRDLIHAEDKDLQTSINLWAGLSVMMMLLGIWIAARLASSESKVSTEFYRLSSILRVAEDPIIVFDPGGAAVFMNDAFGGRFGGGAHDAPNAFGYLNSTAEGDRSREVWKSMMTGLAARASWTTEVPYTTGGRTYHFRLYAIARRNVARELTEIVVFHSDVSEYRRLHVKAREAEDQYRSVVDHSPDALVVIQNEEVIYANAAALELFEFRQSDTISEKRFSELFGPAGRLAFHVSMRGRSVGEQILQNAEFRATTRQGRLIDVEASASIVRWEEDLALQATFRDITERKKLEREQALWAWEQDALGEIDRRLVGVVDLQKVLQSIIQQVLNLSRAHWAGILMYEDSDRFVRWRAMRGQTHEEEGKGRFEITPTIRALFSGGEPLIAQELKDTSHTNMSSLPGLVNEGIISSAWLPLRVRDHEEGVLAVGYRSYHPFEEREMRLLTSLAEKTAIALANASLYQDLIQSERELKTLSGARVDAEEEERRRIAREIHDGLGQILTAIKLNIEIMEDAPGIEDSQKTRFADIKGLLDSVMKEAREISYNLMPSVLEDFGLAPALQLLIERFGATSTVQSEFFTKGDMRRLDHRMEIALYRIVQEALTNSVRHGKADRITVQLSFAEDMLRLTIEDNGGGLDESRAKLRRAEGGGIGLASMRERVNSFNGQFEIESSPGRGTLIIVEMPLDTKQEQAKI